MQKTKQNKINFRINYCSSEDPEYPSAQLLLQSPSAKGWQTPRYCAYPQQLIFELVQPSKLKQISFLSHQHKISSRVEIQYKLDKQSDFKRVGHFSFGDNMQSGFTVRELKNVWLSDIPCLMLKIKFNKNHVNKNNIFNQIGLVCICFYGQTLANKNRPVSQALEERDNYYNNQNNKKPLQQGEFDKNTLKRLRELEVAKQLAVEHEDYEKAKALKYEIENLKKVGSQLADLQQRKKIAVQKQDFDSAKIIQDEIRRIRDMNGGGPNISMNPTNYNIIKKQPLKKKQEEPVEEQEMVSISPVTRVERNLPQQRKIVHNTPKVERKIINAQRKTVDHDEVQIKVTNSDPYGMNNQKMEEEQSEANQKELKQPENLKPQFSKLIDPYTDIIEQDVFKKIFSKVYQHRESGLQQVKSIMDSFKGDKNRMINAVLMIVKNTIDDKIATVILNSLDLFDRLLKKYKPNTVDSSGNAETIVYKLSDYQGHTNQKIKISSYQLFADLPKYNMTNKNICLQGLVTHEGKKAPSPKIVSGRLDMIKKIGEQFKIGNNFQDCVQYAVKYVDDKNNEVRTSSMALIKLLMDQAGYQKVSPFLKNVRAPIIKSIEAMIEQDVPTNNRNNGNGINNGNKFDEDRPIKPKNNQKQMSEYPEEVVITTNITPQGGNSKKQPKKQPKHQQQESYQQQNVKNPQFYCEFCDKYDKQFANEDFRDIHLFNACPMLTMCECKQAIQVSSYTSHLLSQCEKKNNYKKCPRCQEAIHQKNYTTHVKSKECLPAKPLAAANRCPICHQDIEQGREGWKQHLAVQGCPNHSRSR